MPWLWRAPGFVFSRPRPARRAARSPTCGVCRAAATSSSSNCWVPGLVMSGKKRVREEDKGRQGRGRPRTSAGGPVERDEAHRHMCVLCAQYVGRTHCVTVKWPRATIDELQAVTGRRVKVGDRVCCAHFHEHQELHARGGRFTSSTLPRVRTEAATRTFTQQPSRPLPARPGSTELPYEELKAKFKELEDENRRLRALASSATTPAEALPAGQKQRLVLVLSGATLLDWCGVSRETYDKLARHFTSRATSDFVRSSAR